MANHNKNKKFGNSNFERVRKTRPVGQDALERERLRRLERSAIRPIAESDDDLMFDYSDND